MANACGSECDVWMCIVLVAKVRGGCFGVNAAQGGAVVVGFLSSVSFANGILRAGVGELGAQRVSGQSAAPQEVARQ